jgi:hypothetical protein
MKMLSSIQTGRDRKPPRLFLYGVEGIGKSSLAANTPNPIFISTEDGLGEIDCHKFPLARSLGDVETSLNELATEEHDYSTVIIDTADWLEKLVWDELCNAYGVSSIEKVDGGYGKGYVHALTYWRKIINSLTKLRDERNMMVLLLAHAKVERFEDPEAAAYDRYSPRLNKHAAALVSEWCDAVLFASRKFVTKTETGAFNRTRNKAVPVGADGGERILRCVGGPACIAKNRYDLPGELPLDWNALAVGIFSQETTINQPQVIGETNNG